MLSKKNRVKAQRPASPLVHAYLISRATLFGHDATTNKPATNNRQKTRDEIRPVYMQ